MATELQPKTQQVLPANPSDEVSPIEALETEAVTEVETAPTKEEPDAVEDELDIEAILGNDPEDKKPPVVADPTTPEFKQLAEQFEQVMGVDLAKALEQYTTIQAQMEEMRQTINQQEAKQSLQTLQDAWDVTPKELDRRVAAVLKVVNAMTPAQKERYDSLEGVQKLWSRIEGTKAKSAPASGGEKKSKVTTDAPSFTTSQLRKMMRDTPGLYDQKQALIREAYAAGRVTDDL